APTPSPSPVPTPTPTPSEEPFTSLGCFADMVTARDLTGAFEVFPDTNSPERCFAFCEFQGFEVFANQFGRECFCGSQAELGFYGMSSGCTFECTGDPSQFCGGPDANQAYLIGSAPTTPPAPAPPTPTPAPSPTPMPSPTPPPAEEPFSFLGCFADMVSDRDLTGARSDFASSNSEQTCFLFCQLGG
ncbi:unnamed protein product, partial [Chrysoparadoxa australica]